MIIEKTNYGKPAVTENVTSVVTHFVLYTLKQGAMIRKSGFVLSDTLYYLYVIIRYP